MWSAYVLVWVTCRHVYVWEVTKPTPGHFLFSSPQPSQAMSVTKLTEMVYLTEVLAGLFLLWELKRLEVFSSAGR